MSFCMHEMPKMPFIYKPFFASHHPKMHCKQSFMFAFLQKKSQLVCVFAPEKLRNNSVGSIVIKLISLHDLACVQQRNGRKFT